MHIPPMNASGSIGLIMQEMPRAALSLPALISLVPITRKAEFWPDSVADGAALARLLAAQETQTRVLVILPDPLGALADLLDKGLPPSLAEQGFSRFCADMAELARDWRVELALPDRVGLPHLGADPQRFSLRAYEIALILVRSVNVAQAWALVSDHLPQAAARDPVALAGWPSVWCLSGESDVIADLQKRLIAAETALDCDHQRGPAASVAVLQARVAALSAQLDEAAQTIAAQERDLGALRASRSWRLTAPLRRVMALVARARGR